MKRTARLLTFAILVAAISAAASSQTPFARGPYSGAPSASSIVISWVLASPEPAKLEIAPIEPDGAQEVSSRILDAPAAVEGSHGQVDVSVDDLNPGTTYAYRVVVQSGADIVSSPIGHFKTAPNPNETVTFAVVSDTQWQWEGTNRLAVIGDAIAFDSALSGGFDFILHAGDLVETPNAYYWEPWFRSFEPMLLAAPFIPVLGNHEKNSVSYYNAFAHPPGGGENNERWWALHWGDVVVVGLDTNVTRPDQVQQQQDYARAELSGSERWKFVIFHHPVYSSDAYHGSGYGYDKIYHPIFVQAGVAIVFNGHAHNYERIEKDGVVYLVVGGGGAVPRGLAPTRVDGSVIAIENHNFYARVSTAPDKISVDIVSVAEATETQFVPTPGLLLDSFVVTAPVQTKSTVGISLPAPAGAQTESSVPAQTVSTTPIVSQPLLEAASETQGTAQEVVPAAAVAEPPAEPLHSGTAVPSIPVWIALLALLAIAAWSLLRADR